MGGLHSLIVAAASQSAASTSAVEPNSLEAASPFLFTIALIVVSAWVVPDIIERLERTFKEARTKQEAAEADKAAKTKRAWLMRLVQRLLRRSQTPPKKRMPLPDEAPETQAMASIWAIDVAQIPLTIGTPAVSALVLHNIIPSKLAAVYFAILAAGVIFFITFRRWISISWYVNFGPRILRVRLSPLVLIGIGLNAVGAGAAALLIGH